MTMTADIFWRVFNRSKVVRDSDEAVRTVRVTVPQGASLDAILGAGEVASGVALRARGHLGPFEVQTDEGVWYNDGKALMSGRTRFRTWEEMEKAEVEKGDPWA